MFVPVCDRPSVAKPTGAQDRAVMETKSGTIHRKMPMPARQLPITGSAHKAGIVGDAQMGARFAALDMTAQRPHGSSPWAEGPRSAALDRRHGLELARAHVAGVGGTPNRPAVAEDVRHLDRWP